ncbi:MAG TPA: type IV toxin-antitoxin system AbiEi family antitoxin domain-containing protein [Thermoanaerobaculia bacterium]|nr:type IV toxin-antitoxin system AbiEi family antitoxin domain-containing protein [Thermoanaerobaculia bacterium]
MEKSPRSRVLQIGARGRLFTSAEAGAKGVHTSVLTRMTRNGVIERVARGQYRLTGAEMTRHHSLVLAATAVPDGVICLLSSLGFHDIGTQLPSEVWIARGRGTWEPHIEYPRLRIVRFSGEALRAGIDEHRLEGRVVRIYSVAKTIADCFKFRNKIGLDVALEALSDAWRRRRFRMEEIERYARICRVSNVMRPYLEALVA